MGAGARAAIGVVVAVAVLGLVKEVRSRLQTPPLHTHPQARWREDTDTPELRDVVGTGLWMACAWSPRWNFSCHINLKGEQSIGVSAETNKGGRSQKSVNKPKVVKQQSKRRRGWSLSVEIGIEPAAGETLRENFSSKRPYTLPALKYTPSC